jgi:transposase-like protein
MSQTPEKKGSDMNIDQLRQRFPNELACQLLFESVMWQKGRYCPHCHAEKYWLLKGFSARFGLYQCSDCGQQFTATTKTPMHSTKLPL